MSHPSDDWDHPEFIVQRVEKINGACCWLYYAITGEPRRMVKVYRRTWALDAAYWPPGVGDVIDPEYGTLIMRPR